MNNIVNTFKKTGASRQLVMFPFGGGNGFSFLEIVNTVDRRDIEILLVNPPGHLFCDRKPLRSVKDMVQLYLAELRPMLRDDVVIFGHSLGGIVAYEVCRLLEKEKSIRKLFISAVTPPHCVLDDVTMNSRMDDETLIKECFDMGGIRGAFTEDSEILDKFTSALRADLFALENYKAPENREILKTPATILYGADDVMNPVALRQWDRYLVPGKFIKFEGKHFYLFDAVNKPTVSRLLLESLGFQPPSDHRFLLPS
ncbi:MAG: alpha/beta fold hydrolase [bacterium]|nr:alpha/beta fold hydrolase [bacterium]